MGARMCGMNQSSDNNRDRKKSGFSKSGPKPASKFGGKKPYQKKGGGGSGGGGGGKGGSGEWKPRPKKQGFGGKGGWNKDGHKSNKDFRPRKQGGMQGGRPQQFRKPPVFVQPTTLWDYPSQHYGDDFQGDPNYRGATPSYVIWNMLQRYTEEGDLVIDPCCGSGTTLDVARDLNRKALGYDVNPTRDDIYNVDARDLPLEEGKADMVFVDPPYSTHIEYSDDVRCIGKLDAGTGEYYEAMEMVLGEIYRVLKPGGVCGVYVSDSYEHRGQNKGFHAIGFVLFGQMMKLGFEPVDIVSVVRHNRTLEMGNYRAAAEEENFFLRGFNYLFIVRKPGGEPRVFKKKGRKKKAAFGGNRQGGFGSGQRGGFGGQEVRKEKQTQKGIQFYGDRPADGPINRKRKGKKKKKG